MTPLLSVQNLHVDFFTRHGLIKAVSGVDFSLYPGEILGIVGESGCGKSAMAKALTKLLPDRTSKMQGSVLFEETNLLHCSEKKLQSIRGKKIGMIFQDPMTCLNPTLKVGEQVIEGYRKHHPHIPYKEAFQHALDMLKAVGIPDPSVRFSAYPHTLSGGMRQKATIALALASKPQLIIADEPTTALDVTVQAQILTFMKSFQKAQGTSILLITHDLSLVAGFCDRVLVMYAGKIVEEAPVEELFYHPKHPYTQRLLQAIPRIDLPLNQTLLPIDGMPPLLHEEPKGCAFFPRCLQAQPLCKQNPPPLLQLTNQSYCRCWLHDKEGAS
jgi:oligopeptide/dipeptide ABC transporter ATP-binding protein